MWLDFYHLIKSKGRLFARSVRSCGSAGPIFFALSLSCFPKLHEEHVSKLPSTYEALWRPFDDGRICHFSKFAPCAEVVLEVVNSIHGLPLICISTDVPPSKLYPRLSLNI